ncbi:hypothetical protein CKA32_004649 [Geitlerinema sp. FC II]|nr:hypothetical protein CKA32_004649 [Geitlerinema sp. FC II]
MDCSFLSKKFGILIEASPLTVAVGLRSTLSKIPLTQVGRDRYFDRDIVIIRQRMKFILILL